MTIVQGGAGVVTLSAGSGATLTGTAVFTTQNEAKTLVAVSRQRCVLSGAIMFPLGIVNQGGTPPPHGIKCLR